MKAILKEWLNPMPQTRGYRNLPSNKVHRNFVLARRTTELCRENYGECASHRLHAQLNEMHIASIERTTERRELNFDAAIVRSADRCPSVFSSEFDSHDRVAWKAGEPGRG